MDANLQSVVSLLLRNLLLRNMVALFLAALVSHTAIAFSFSTGNPDGRIATASRPSSAGKIEIESADDFVLTQDTSIDHATFTGLLPSRAPFADIGNVRIEIYRVFPLDSVVPPSGRVVTRVNSPSDIALLERDVATSTLNFTASLLNASFTAANSVLNGIHPLPNQTTGGEGAVTGEEVLFDVSLSSPLVLAPGHYFFIPQVELANGDFLWLSAPRPIVAPGDPFAPDLQSWIRNGDLAPDWSRIGTDIVGGGPPPAFNGTFSLSGAVVPEPHAMFLLTGGLAALLLLHRRRARAFA